MTYCCYKIRHSGTLKFVTAKRNTFGEKYTNDVALATEFSKLSAAYSYVTFAINSYKMLLNEDLDGCGCEECAESRSNLEDIMQWEIVEYNVDIKRTDTEVKMVKNYLFDVNKIL